MPEVRFLDNPIHGAYNCPAYQITFERVGQVKDVPQRTADYLLSEHPMMFALHRNGEAQIDIAAPVQTETPETETPDADEPKLTLQMGRIVSALRDGEMHMASIAAALGLDGWRDVKRDVDTLVEMGLLEQVRQSNRRFVYRRLEPSDGPSDR